jgi:glyoxylate carboligase
MTVLEPAQVPGAFQQGFHLMRSGRPGPVLIDLPLDVQMAEIEFDPDTYVPLPIHRPRASRGQVEKALAMLVPFCAPTSPLETGASSASTPRPRAACSTSAETVG